MTPRCIFRRFRRWYSRTRDPQPLGTLRVREVPLTVRTEVLTVDRREPDADAIARAARCLVQGGLVAFPTETVYGLGVHALDRSAVLRLFEAKGRPAHDPLIVHVATLADVSPLVEGLPRHASRLADTFWPGPLTLIMERSAAVPGEVSAGLGTVAIRIPAHPVARALLQAAGIPIAAPSANLFSRPSPTRAEHVLQDLDGRIDIVLDAGPTDVGVESTVLDLTTDPAVLLRAGAVSLESIRTVVPDAIVMARSAADAGLPMPSPGLLSKHYAPRAPLTLYRGNSASVRAAMRQAINEAVQAGTRVGVLATDGDREALRALDVVFAGIGDADRAESVASRLYSALRELDLAGVDVILVQDAPHDDGLWRAVRDRLRRAAASIVSVPDQPGS